MNALETALLAAVEHYTDVLSTPHVDFRAFRAKVLRAKAAVAILSRMVERGAEIEFWASQKPKAGPRPQRVVH